MFKSLMVVVMLASLGAAERAVLPPGVALPSQQGLAQLFFNSRVTALDPRTAMACFADYILHSNAIGESYSQDYNQCLSAASDERDAVQQGVIEERKAIVDAAGDVCKRLSVCNQYENTLEMFSCHARAGPNNTQDTYAISGNSSEYASYMQERYRIIDLHHKQCCHAAERSYVGRTAENYNYLQGCLDGRVKPRPAPTTTTSTTSTTTTTTTTEAPPSTTTPAATETPATESQMNLQDQFKQLLNLLN